MLIVVALKGLSLCWGDAFLLWQRNQKEDEIYVYQNTLRLLCA